MKRGIIFDLDGTMVNNMMVHHRAWQQKLAEYGMVLTLEEVMEKVHGINEEILKKLFGDRFTAAERRRISAEKEKLYRSIFAKDLKLIEGLPAFLEAAKAAGVPMAVGTAAPRENAYFVLDRLDLHAYFEGVFHAEDVTKGKPDPEVFELAAASMGLRGSDCLIFEDSLSGAEAAKRAGANAVIVTTTHQREEFATFDHIVRFVDDFQGLRVEDLVQV